MQVAAHRSFSRAAEELGLTQPSVTARIQGLERNMQETLFERNGRGVGLTEVGASFLPHVQRVLKALQDGRAAGQSVRKRELGPRRPGSARASTTPRPP